MANKIDIRNITKISDHSACENNLEKFEKKLDELDIKVPDSLKDFGFYEVLKSIFGNSPFLSSLIINHTEFFIDIFENNFKDPYEEIIYSIECLKTDRKIEIESFLRVQKQKIALLVATAEIIDFWSSEKAMEKLSEFADACVTKASEFLMQQASRNKVIEVEDFSNPLYRSGLLVIALGKLGSYELNYSSDIDICVFYEENKLKYIGKQNLNHFFIGFSQNLIDILSKRTKDGYVFRTDMRLRPDPAANPLSVSLNKAEKYYYTIGQNWERAAMIKSRQVCGDLESGRIFSNFMGKNIWRKALDFETIEDIHSIKRQIDTKQGIHPEDLFGYNIKVGKGGIREIEFYCQTQQLIWGGRKHSLRVKKTIKALEELENEGEITKKARTELSKAYLFLRFVEHRLQMVNDQQTHSLPKSQENFDKISIFCGYEDSEKFKREIIKHITNVKKHYSKLFETSPSLASQIPEAQGSLVFTGAENDPETIKTLKKLGFNEGEKISEIIRGWHHGRYPCTLKKRSRAVLTKLMPTLINSFSKSPYPDAAFIRFDDFLSRLPEGSQIFSMLYLNPSIMDLLAEIMGAYRKIALNLTKNPDLLDYVLAPEFYNTLPDIEYLKNNLDEALSNSQENIDDKFEVIKDWADDRKFRIGIQLVREEINTEEVQYALSNIAEVVIYFLMKIIQEDFRKTTGTVENGKFAVVALGKLGSRELTFNSDLDIVFIYDFPESSLSVNQGNVTPSSYYIRYASKLVYGLSSITRTGKMYEVDLRLRPLGESGPIATSLKSYEEYFNPNKVEGAAWIWEYMALTRARVFSLDNEFKDLVYDVIRRRLSHPWSKEVLKNKIKFIYKKYYDNKKVGDNFDVKNIDGGLFDLEFMVRFLQFSNMIDNPDITDNETIETIEKLRNHKIISEKEEVILTESFKFYCTILNILRITGDENIAEYTKKVLCKLLDIKNVEVLDTQLSKRAKQVRKIFEKYLSFCI